MNTKELLIAARKKIEKSENWTKGRAARDARGNPVGSFHRDAFAWCAVGALWHVTSGNGRTALKAETALDDVTGGIIGFNDTHSHAEILAAYDAAIAAQGDA